VCLCLGVCVCVCLGVCLYVCVCMYIYVCVCVCVWYLCWCDVCSHHMSVASISSCLIDGRTYVVSLLGMSDLLEQNATVTYQIEGVTLVRSASLFRYVDVLGSLLCEHLKGCRVVSLLLVSVAPFKALLWCVDVCLCGSVLAWSRSLQNA
jgi:hypothetical protein